MKVSVLLASSLVLGMFVPAQAQSAPTKVGIINIQKAIVSTKDGQKAVAEIEAKAAPKKKELESKQQAILQKQEQLNKVGNVGGEDAKQKLIRDIDTMKKSFSREVDDAQADFDQENAKVMNDLGNRVMQVLDKYAKDNGFALIIDVSNPQTSSVLYAANGIDVTDDIVALYDKNAPSTIPTSAPAARPAGPAPRPAAPATKPPAK